MRLSNEYKSLLKGVLVFSNLIKGELRWLLNVQFVLNSQKQIVGTYQYEKSKVNCTMTHHEKKEKKFRVKPSIAQLKGNLQKL